MTPSMRSHPFLAAISRPVGKVGALLTLAILALLLAGLFLPVQDPFDATGLPGQGPSTAHWLGTDMLGRDVFSRVLHGGNTVILLATAATLVTYLLGCGIGCLAGYLGGWFDAIVMRAVDIFISFPSLLLILILIAAVGKGTGVLVLAVALAMMTHVSRIIRTATQEVAVRGYVEVAVARGEGVGWIIAREIFPNIARPLLADLGVRFSYAVILIASVNYLGLGLQPPSPDWGLMVADNVSILALNPWATVAPALLLALLTIAVNLIADSYAATIGHELAAPVL